MTLQEHADYINKMLAEHPESKEYIVIFAKDDSPLIGTSYIPVLLTPTLCNYDQEKGDLGKECNVRNAVCIN